MKFSRTGEMSVSEACRILGVRKTDSQEEISRKYKHLMLKFHPDKHRFRILPDRLKTGTEERTKNINLAFELLKNASADEIGRYGLAPDDTTFEIHYGADPSLAGELQWSFRTKGGIHLEPLFSAGTVYVASDDKHIYALNGLTGDVKWKFRGHVASSLCADDGILYFFTGKETIYAINMAGPRVEWTSEAIRPGAAFLMAADGVVYVASKTNRFYALNGKDGSYLWSFETRGKIKYPPFLVAGKVGVPTARSVYLLGLDGEFEEFLISLGPISGPPVGSGKTICYSTSHGELCAIDVSTAPADSKWELRTGGPMLSKPLLIQDKLVGIFLEGDLCAVDVETGRRLWRYKIADLTYHSPVFHEGTVYIGSRDGIVTGVDLETGAERISFKVETDVLVTSPTVGERMLYFGSDEGKLYAVAI